MNRPLKMRYLAGRPALSSTNTVAAAASSRTTWAKASVAPRRSSFTYRSKIISAHVPTSTMTSGSAGRWSMTGVQFILDLGGPDMLEKLVHRSVHHLGEGQRVDAHEQHRGGERGQDRGFPPVQVDQPPHVVVRDVAED